MVLLNGGEKMEIKGEHMSDRPAECIWEEAEKIIKEVNKEKPRRGLSWVCFPPSGLEPVHISDEYGDSTNIASFSIHYGSASVMEEQYEGISAEATIAYTKGPSSLLYWRRYIYPLEVTYKIYVKPNEITTIREIVENVIRRYKEERKVNVECDDDGSIFTLYNTRLRYLRGRSPTTISIFKDYILIHCNNRREAKMVDDIYRGLKEKGLVLSGNLPSKSSEL